MPWYGRVRVVIKSNRHQLWSSPVKSGPSASSSGRSRSQVSSLRRPSSVEQAGAWPNHSAQRRMSRPLLGARKAPRGTHPHTRYESHAGRNFRPWTANNLHGGHCCYWQTCLLSLHVLCRRTYSVLATIRHLIHLARD